MGTFDHLRDFLAPRVLKAVLALGALISTFKHVGNFWVLLALFSTLGTSAHFWYSVRFWTCLGTLDI